MTQDKILFSVLHYSKLKMKRDRVPALSDEKIFPKMCRFFVIHFGCDRQPGLTRETLCPCNNTTKGRSNSTRVSLCCFSFVCLFSQNKKKRFIIGWPAKRKCMCLSSLLFGLRCINHTFALSMPATTDSFLSNVMCFFSNFHVFALL